MSDQEARRRVMLDAFEEVLSGHDSAPQGFEILHELDRGGMAVVYLARQLQPEREVALKVMLPQFAGNEEVGERFQREGRAMAALDHPGVLPVHQVGEWDEMPFLAMKLARGGTLQERLQEGEPEIREAVSWMIEVGEAVHFAHQRGVLHRDLKPGNLLFDQEGKIYVGDFGVAKLDFVEDGGLTRTEALVGTPNYLAPEVASGDTNAGSVAADLYGLGAVLYECLTGRRPHDGADNLAAQLRNVVEKEVTPVRKIKPEVPRDLEVICAKALAKNPADRYESVARFVEDLERWRDGRVILARPARLPEKLWRWAKRHPFPAMLSALFAMTLILGGSLFVQNYRRQVELLQELLLKGAKDERREREPGFRERAFGLLGQIENKEGSEEIREEAAAILTHWDVGEGEIQAQESAAIDPSRLQVLEEGVRVTGPHLDDEGWLLPGGALRCDPAWSSDGRFLAMVRGKMMEVVIYDVPRREEFCQIAAKDWPEELTFDESGERLKISFEDGSAMLASVCGEVLLKGFDRRAELMMPVGFSMWTGQIFSASEAIPYGGSLSPDHAFLATVSVSGVQVWDVEKKRSRYFHETGNQRIDAPTDAWWLSERDLLIQVPGSLEVLTLSEDGQLLEEKEIDRVPGTRIEEVLANGDWLVEARDEDGEVSLERWLEGDPDRARDWSETELVQEEKIAAGVDRVKVGEWSLILPWEQKVQQVFVLEEEERVIVLTQSYHLFEWDLAVLGRELKRRGL